PGMLVLTSRQDVPELEGFGTMVLQHPLEELSDEAGADLLVDLGVWGPEDELRAAVHDLRGRALWVALLGTYLAEGCSGDVRARDRLDFADIILTAQEQENVDRTVRYARRAERVLEAYLKVFETQAEGPDGVGGPERALLHLLGLFDRVADGPAV